MIKILEPILNVYILSSFTILIGYILDFTISLPTLKKYTQDKFDLYVSGIQSTMINLLLIAPINYIILFNYLLFDFTYSFNFYNLLKLLLTHNILYFLLHMLVHNVRSIRFIHDFHHKFTTNLPSIGNAVSILEFQFLYVIPFLIGTIVFKPNIMSINLSILIISVMNSIIHSNELKYSYWIPFLVSPQQHGEHHQTYHKTYSAPLFNLDLLFKKY